MEDLICLLATVRTLNICFQPILNFFYLTIYCVWQRTDIFMRIKYYMWNKIVLRGHNCVHFAHKLLVYCYHEFKLRYDLKNQKLFSIRVKELFEPIVVRKKKKATGFCSF